MDSDWKLHRAKLLRFRIQDRRKKIDSGETKYAQIVAEMKET